MSFLDAITPGVGSLASGLLSAGSNIFGGIVGSQGQAATNAQAMAMQIQQENFNASEAWKQRDWMEYMQSSAYQRTMGDMKKAGLNPILAADRGATPIGSGASAGIGGNPVLGNPGAAMQAGIASAGQAASVAAGTKALLTQANKDDSQVDLNKATTKKADSETTLNDALTTQSKQSTATSAAQAKVADEQAGNWRQDTLNKIIEGVKLTHDATSAGAIADINKRKAQDAVRFGAGAVGEATADINRTANTFHDWLADKWNQVVDTWRSRDVQSTIDQQRANPAHGHAPLRFSPVK